MLNVQMRCEFCGSTDVRRNSDSVWDVEKQEWVVCALFDATSCESCGREDCVEEEEIPDQPPQKTSLKEIRLLSTQC